ncbi:MAG: cupin domain-containing protein [Sedimentisphaerales bacterium]|nr:cupin domain-containing protein [Sedimentisphaerales bacterium]
MIIKKPSDVPAVPVEMEGANKVTVRVMFGPKDKAPTFAMRIFELAGGGNTPYHKHPFEHEAVILSGDIALVTPDGDKPVAIGDVVLVMPDEIHAFKNRSDTKPASFMCLVPVEYQK